MNLEREVVLTRKMVLIAVVSIVAALIFMGCFVVYRLEKDRVDVSELPVEPTPSPVTVSPTPDFLGVPENESPVDETAYDNSLDAGLAVIAALTDDDRTNDNITDSFGRNNFLKMLASQMGSTGEIIGGGMSTYKYYTEWYIGGYPEDLSWNESTPWCASYVSWCIEQVSLSVSSNIPCYANVDNFILHFWEETWLSPLFTPTPGDLVFFGFMNDPNHMGVVIAVEDDYIYTIEGNVNDTVAIRKYKTMDSAIIGYGLLNWVN